MSDVQRQEEASKSSRPDMPSALAIPRLLGGAAKVVGVAASCITAGLMLLTVIDVTMRALTDRGLPGSVEFSEVALAGAVFLGMGFAYSRDQHPKISIALRRFTPKVRLTIETCGRLCTLAILSWLMVATGIRAFESMQIGEYRFGLLKVPVWPGRLALPAGILFVWLLVLTEIVKGMGTLRSLYFGAEKAQVDADV